MPQACYSQLLRETFRTPPPLTGEEEGALPGYIPVEDQPGYGLCLWCWIYFLLGKESQENNPYDSSSKGSQHLQLLKIQRTGPLELDYLICYLTSLGAWILFKNHVDVSLSSIPDQPTMTGLGRAAETNSLLHEQPIFYTV